MLGRGLSHLILHSSIVVLSSCTPMNRDLWWDTCRLDGILSTNGIVNSDIT